MVRYPLSSAPCVFLSTCIDPASEIHLCAKWEAWQYSHLRKKNGKDSPTPVNEQLQFLSCVHSVYEPKDPEGPSMNGEKTPAALIIFHVGLWVLESSPVYLVKVAWSLSGIGGKCRLYSSQTASPPSHFARSLLSVASIPGFKCFPLHSNPSHCLSASFSPNKLHAQFVCFLRCRGWSRFLFLPRWHILLLFFSLLFFSSMLWGWSQYKEVYISASRLIPSLFMTPCASEHIFHCLVSWLKESLKCDKQKGSDKEQMLYIASTWAAKSYFQSEAAGGFVSWTVPVISD